MLVVGRFGLLIWFVWVLLCWRDVGDCLIRALCFCFDLRVEFCVLVCYTEDLGLGMFQLLLELRGCCVGCCSNLLLLAWFYELRCDCVNADFCVRFVYNVNVLLLYLMFVIVEICFVT